MSRFFYFLVFICSLTHPLQKVYGMEDNEDCSSSQPAGIHRTPDGKAAIIYGYFDDGVNCGSLTTLEEALDGLPDHPFYHSFKDRYLAIEERITSLEKDGQAFEERWKAAAEKGNSVLALFCEDFGLDVNDATKKFGVQKLKKCARGYLAHLTKMHRDYQDNVISQLKDAQMTLNLDLRYIVDEFPAGPDIPTFLKFHVNYYQEEFNTFVDELKNFSTDIQYLKQALGLGAKVLDDDSLKYTTYHRYRIGNLVLQYNLLRIIRDVTAPFLEFFPGLKSHFISLPESDFDQLLSKHLYTQQQNLGVKEEKGRKGRNRRQVNKNHKLKTPKREVDTNTIDLPSVRGLSLYEAIEVPALEEVSVFDSASPLPPGGYKSQYRKDEEPTKVKTYKVSEDKEKEKETPKKAQTFENTGFSQNIFYAENPDVLERLIRCEKLELNEYLNLLKDLVLSNPAIFEKVEFTGQHGTHPVFRLCFRNGMSYSWEISQAHGGRFIPQNHNYRKSYRKPFKYLGIVTTGLRDIQEKKSEVRKECELKEKEQEGAKVKKKRKRNRKKKGNTPLNNPSSNQEKQEPGAGATQLN